MKTNIFEGFRRIQYLLQGLWVLGCIIGAWNSGSSLDVIYVKYPYLPSFILEDGMQCNKYQDVKEPLEKASYTAYGTDIKFALCFLAQEFSNGQFLIPFKAENGIIYGNTEYSNDVKNYIGKEIALFEIEANDHKELDKRIIKFRWRKIQDVLGWGLGGFYGISLICFIIGWIVRGFIGIPQGQDARSN
jgi:hypothetical protein